MFRGKVVIVCNSLQCSAEVEFTRSVLERFGADLQRIYDTLNGSFHLVSSDTRFKMAVVGDNKGRIRLDIVVSGFQFSQPENNEWSASATFTCFPYEIENAIQQIEEANKKSSLLTGQQPVLLTPSSIQSRP